MDNYKVAYIIQKYEETTITAENVDEAKAKWEEEGIDADLFFIEDKAGNQTFFS